VTNSAERPDSVRLALPREAEAIAELQHRSWSEHFAEYPDLVAGLDATEMTKLWHQAITRPPVAQCRVLVAVDTDDRVVGFASTLPADDPDAEQGVDGTVGEFIVDPGQRHRGHGSRLLNACVDTLRADGFQRATYWVSSTDDDIRRFLTGAGWAPDGSRREIGLADDSMRIKQIRLHTDITATPE
jgi:GNAT superfamily N-acetyltransferase